MIPPHDDALESKIAALTQSVRANRESLDDATRFSALKAARGLVEALGSPPEKVIQDVVLVCSNHQPVISYDHAIGSPLETNKMQSGAEQC